MICLRQIYPLSGCASRAPFFIICGVSRHRHPLNQPAKGRPNPLNLLNPGHGVAL